MPIKEDLTLLQKQSLERKIRITQTRIIEWYLHYKGQVYISFSGGKDSTVLLDITRRIYPDIEALFISTGLEYPEIEEFARTFDNVTIVRAKKTFKQVIEEYGYPVISKEVADCIQGARKGQKYRIARLNGTLKNAFGEKSNYCTQKYSYLLDAPFKISHYCCNVMKKKPAHDFEKRTGKRAILGTMTEESRLRQSAWMRTGCNSFEGRRQISTPMSFWTEQDILQYLKITNIPYCSVYGDIVPKSEFIGQLAFDDIPTDLMTTGCQRTGCMFCMFGVHLEKEPNRFQKMKITHPKLYKYCIEDLECGKVMDFIGVKY